MRAACARTEMFERRTATVRITRPTYVMGPHE
jgi:hypothetical protein